MPETYLASDYVSPVLPNLHMSLSKRGLISGRERSSMSAQIYVSLSNTQGGDRPTEATNRYSAKLFQYIAERQREDHL